MEVSLPHLVGVTDSQTLPPPDSPMDIQLQKMCCCKLLSHAPVNWVQCSAGTLPTPYGVRAKIDVDAT